MSAGGVVRRPTIHDVLPAANARDAAAAIGRDPSLENYSVITRESQLYGLWIREWAATEAAAAGMRNYPRMVTYLQYRAQFTREVWGDV